MSADKLDEIAERAVDRWEELEGESMRDGYRHTMVNQIRAALDEARQEDRAEIERLRATLTESDQIYVLWRDRAEAAEADARRLIEARDGLVEALTAERAKVAKLVEALAMTRETIGDLSIGFHRAVNPAIWVEQVQASIDAALAAAKASEEKKP